MTQESGPTAAVKGLWEEYVQTRDVSLRDRLVTEHLGLARRLARRYDYRGQSQDDLFQVASIGLLKAVSRFDPSREVEFTTFATTTIVGELKRYFRDRGWAIRAPRRLQELYLELGPAAESLGHRLGRPPTITELAAEVGSTEESVIEALEAGQGYRTASIDAPGDGNRAIADRMATEDAAISLVDDLSEIAPALRSLPERSRKIIRLRFVEGMTQSEIARQVGISQMHVSRLLSESLAQLRKGIAQSD
ncbi:MAG: SigB/SigF/SigG family RNA polymerase sigma factor [Acidimicrobiales bacterium]